MDGRADVERPDAVAAGVQQILRLGQAVGRDLELGLDDAPPPGIRHRVADAAEERQCIGRQQPLAQHLRAVADAQAHRIDLQRVGAAHIVQAVGEAGCQDVSALLGHQKLATRRPVLAQMREDHQLRLCGGHVGRPRQKSSSLSSAALMPRTRWVFSRALSESSAGSFSDNSSNRVLPGAMASR